MKENDIKEKKKSFKISAKRWGGYILISIWMFMLGVFVGRGMITVQFEKEYNMPDQTPLYTTEDNSTDNDEGDRSINKEDLRFYETLKSSDPNRLADENITVVKLPEKEITREDTNKTEIKIEGNRKSGAEIRNVSDKKRYFTIQVAAFKNEKDARKFIEILKNKGFIPYVTVESIKDRGVWHRVRIGGFDNRAETEGIMEKLRRSDFKPFVLEIEKGSKNGD